MAFCLQACKHGHQDESAGPMTACSICLKWFHDDCLGFPKKAFVPFYACVDCVPKLRAFSGISALETSVADLKRRVCEAETAVVSLKEFKNVEFVSSVEKIYTVEADLSAKVGLIEAQLAELTVSLNEFGNKCSDTQAEVVAAPPTFASVVKSAPGVSKSVPAVCPFVKKGPTSSAAPVVVAAQPESGENGWQVAKSRKKSRAGVAAARSNNAAATASRTFSAAGNASISCDVGVVPSVTPTRGKSIIATIPDLFDTAVLGCSIIRHTAAVNKSKGIATISVPGGKISDLVEVVAMLPKLFGMPPSRIILHCGTNDWADWASAEQIANLKRELVLSVRKLCPNAKIFVVGILCRRDSKSTDIRDVNSRILASVRNLQDVFFVDANVRYRTTDWIGRDGLHLNRFGVTSLAKLFVEPFPKNS
jgi:hypothetical protein